MVQGWSSSADLGSVPQPEDLSSEPLSIDDSTLREEPGGMPRCFSDITILVRQSTHHIAGRSCLVDINMLLLVGSIRDEIRKRGPSSGGTDHDARSSDPEIRQLVTLRTTPDPSGGKVAKLHVPGILRIAEMGGFVVLLQPSAAGVVWHVRSSVASCSCWDGFVFDSSWAINIERSVMSRCDNAQGTSIRSTLVS
jgi:hypothetical protein